MNMFFLKPVLLASFLGISAFTFFPAPAHAIGACGPIEANPGGFYNGDVLDRAFEERLIRALNEIDVTAGFAVGIVKGNQVVYAKGFGYSNLDDCSPVTADTGFYLLSTTKSFTGMTAAILQKQGVLELDESLSHYFPGLKPVDGINWAQVSVRSLLTHGKTFRNAAINFRTFAPGNLPDDQLLDILTTVSEPKDPTFQYSNTGYVMAGYVMQTITGTNWRDLLEQRIFEPLGMDHTTAYMATALKGDYALPYYADESGRMVSGFLKTDKQMHAAGGMVSTVNDLNRWLIANLNQGRLGEEQVLPAYAVRQAQVPQIQFDQTFYKFHRFGYGLGVHNADYEGDLLIHHFGGAIHVSFMPEHDLGIVILTSNSGQGARFAHAVAALAYDTLLGKPDVEQRWDQEMSWVNEGLEETWQRLSNYLESLPGQGNPDDPNIPDEEALGRYTSDRLGDIVISRGEEGLAATYGEIVTNFTRLDGNSFTAYLVPLDLTPPEVVDLRVDPELGWVLDWGGRIFVRQ